MTLYELLGVSPKATPAEIKAAARRAHREHHPDRASDEADRLERVRRCQAVNEAREILLDPEKRAAYDQRLAFGSRYGFTAPAGLTPAGCVRAAEELIGLRLDEFATRAGEQLSPTTRRRAEQVLGSSFGDIAKRMRALFVDESDST